MDVVSQCDIHHGHSLSLVHTTPVLQSISVSISLLPHSLYFSLIFMISKTMLDWIGHYLISPLGAGIQLLFACLTVCVRMWWSLRDVLSASIIQHISATAARMALLGECEGGGEQWERVTQRCGRFFFLPVTFSAFQYVLLHRFVLCS